MLNRYLRYGVIAILGYFLFTLFSHALNYSALSKKNKNSLASEIKALHMEEDRLLKIQADYKARLEFVEKNKIDINESQQTIDAIVQNINASEYFKSTFASYKNSKQWLNVGVYEFDIESLLSSLYIVEFEDLFKEAFEPLGKVLPIVYDKDSNYKKAKLYVLVLNKKGME